MKNLVKNFRFFISCLIILMVYSSCEKDLPTIDIPNERSGYICEEIDFTITPNLVTTEIYNRVKAVTINANQPYVLGNYTLRIKKLKTFSGSDMLRLTTFNGQSAIVFEKNMARMHNYLNALRITMPNLNNSPHEFTYINNKLLPTGTYNILDYVDLDKNEFLLIIDAPVYQTGEFNSQDLWAMKFIADKLDYIVIDNAQLADSFHVDPVSSVPVQIGCELYESEWSMMEVSILPDCGGFIGKKYDHNFIPLDTEDHQ